jgi:hypothetical protein
MLFAIQEINLEIIFILVSYFVTSMACIPVLFIFALILPTNPHLSIVEAAQSRHRKLR